MWSLFRPPTYTDASLGVLVRARGLWRGTLQVRDGLTVPLAVAGPRTAPNGRALALARDVPTALPAWRPAIESAVLTHIAPYVEAIADGELPPPGGIPSVVDAGELWPFITFTHVAAIPLDGRLVVELGLTLPWDEEHTLGARLHEGRLIELCGSVLRP